MVSVTIPDNGTQYLISRNGVGAYDHRFEIRGWTVAFGKQYPLTKILDKHGAPIGTFLGFVIDPSARAFKPETLTLGWDAQIDSQIVLEECLYQCGGSWLAIIASQNVEAIYLDACGSLPLVYRRDEQSCGSSAAALLSGDEYLWDMYPEASSEAWFKADWYHTAGLTAHKSLLRLLPNHRLNLQQWRVERIWPLRPFPSLDAGRVVKEIADASGQVIAAAMAGGGTALVPLTAGNETRALLALTKNLLQRTFYFTGSFPGAVVDVGVAKRLARKFGLRHVLTNVRPRTPEEIQIWRYRTGYCVGGAIGSSRMDRSKLTGVSVELSGAAGEVGRGFLWLPEDNAQDKLSAHVLLARLKLPKLDRFVSAVENWLGSVGQFDAFTVMDLAYIELKMACWAGPQATGSETDVPQIWPFSNRRCFSAMISAPASVRLDQSIFQRIVQIAWPELLEIPINQGSAWENFRKQLYRASSPRRILNRIRKDLAKIRPTKERL